MNTYIFKARRKAWETEACYITIEIADATKARELANLCLQNNSDKLDWEMGYSSGSGDEEIISMEVIL